MSPEATGGRAMRNHAPSERVAGRRKIMRPASKASDEHAFSHPQGLDRAPRDHGACHRWFSTNSTLRLQPAPRAAGRPHHGVVDGRPSRRRYRRRSYRTQNARPSIAPCHVGDKWCSIRTLQNESTASSERIGPLQDLERPSQLRLRATRNGRDRSLDHVRKEGSRRRTTSVRYHPSRFAANFDDARRRKRRQIDLDRSSLTLHKQRLAVLIP